MTAPVSTSHVFFSDGDSWQPLCVTCDQADADGDHFPFDIEHEELEMSNEKLVTELIQVAAVAIQAVTGLTTRPDEENRGRAKRRAVTRVNAELRAQDKKWGDQRCHTPVEWLMILVEEVGEAASEVRPFSDTADIDEQMMFCDLRLAEQNARRWMKNHRWSERQQRVVDAEEADSE